MMDYKNIVYRKFIKTLEDEHAATIFLTLEYNHYSIWVSLRELNEETEECDEQNRLLHVFSLHRRDLTMEKAVDIGKLSLEDILKLPHIAVV